MTDSARQSAQAVAALFAERQRFEAWLATLDAKRAVTPAHIYTRVHADYTARLQRVNEQLSRHRAAMREMESAITDRLTSLDIDEAKNRDEMAEAELRSNVGELSDEDHREILERTALALERVTAERLRVGQELANLRAMLGDDGEIGVLEIGASEVTVTATPPAVPPVAAPPKRGSKAQPAAPGERDAWGLAPNDPLAVPPRASGLMPVTEIPPASPFDDLEFLKSMVDSRASGDHGAVGNGSSAPKSAASAAPPPAESAAVKDAPARTSAPTKRASKDAPAEPAEKEPAHEPAPVATATPSPVSTPATQIPIEPTAPPMPATAGAGATMTKLVDASVSQELTPVGKPRDSKEQLPSYLRDVPPEQVKTLKCQECGTLNYPTEWYCERCGAELAAL